MTDVFKTAPAVFAVGDTYQIMVPVTCEVLMWVKVGEELYYDASNGIIRSDVTTHRMTVPSAELDKAGKYTVCYRKIIERKPYFTECEDEVQVEFEFRPVSGKSFTAYHIADAHNRRVAPVKAMRTFEEKYGKIDFLIMNGDIPDHSGTVENFDTIYEIAADATNGNIPIVFARGNHDLRGVCAEKIADHTPNFNGNTYFTFRIGSVWGIVLDCGEDKPDGNKEYGHTICCHDYRKTETKYLEKVIADKEFEANGIEYKLIVAHSPFIKTFNHPFNIEEDIYAHWADLIRKEIKPDAMICGHLHKIFIEKEDADTVEGTPIKLVVGSMPDFEKETYAGAGFKFENGGIEVTFTDSEGNILSSEAL